MVHPCDVNTQDFVCTLGSSWRCEHAAFVCTSGSSWRSEHANMCVHTWFILALWTRKLLCAHLVHPGAVNTQAFVCTPGPSWRSQHASVCVEVVMPQINICIHSFIHSPSMFLCCRWLWSSCHVAAWFWAVLVERAVAVHPNAFLEVQTPVSWEKTTAAATTATTTRVATTTTTTTTTSD